MSNKALIAELKKAKVRLSGVSIEREHATASIFEAIKALEQSEWVSVSTIPEDNQLVDMWHEDWICEDSNPEGIRQGFLIHNEHWYSGKWIQHQDCYKTSYDEPQKWKPITPPPAEVET